MSPHIIKCKTILKINEIETINLTQYLNFHRHTEPGGGSMCEACGGTLQGFCFCSNCQVVALNGTGGRGVGPGQVQVQSERNYLLCELGIRQALAPDSQRHQGLHERSTTLDGIFPEKPWKGSLSTPVS